jgi:hypothetical protein
MAMWLMYYHIWQKGREHEESQVNLQREHHPVTSKQAASPSTIFLPWQGT